MAQRLRGGRIIIPLSLEHRFMPGRSAGPVSLPDLWLIETLEGLVGSEHQACEIAAAVIEASLAAEWNKSTE